MLGLETAAEFPPRYNIAPTQAVPVCREIRDEGRSLATMRWGLIPPWRRDGKADYRMINARAETLAEKPAFRKPYRVRRCLLPADGFFEWQRVGSRKQPWFICMKDQQPFAFAGLWERRENPGGEPLDSCTIITTGANTLVANIHDRMPVIVRREDFDRWLDPTLTDTRAIESVLQPFPTGELQAFPVSTRVNSPRNDDPACISQSAGPCS
jgi:putative SOS response-associated peptidase YedK